MNFSADDILRKTDCDHCDRAPVDCVAVASKGHDITHLCAVCLTEAVVLLGGPIVRIEQPAQRMKRVLCDCTQGDVCPNGRTGWSLRCVVLKNA